MATEEVSRPRQKELDQEQLHQGEMSPLQRLKRPLKILQGQGWQMATQRHVRGLTKLQAGVKLADQGA
jgi:hypothetical protein